MDKNGSSAKTGNKGLPATPRDGAPVEITGLLKSTLTWLDKLSKAGKFPFKGVEATSKFATVVEATLTRSRRKEDHSDLLAMVRPAPKIVRAMLLRPLVPVL